MAEPGRWLRLDIGWSASPWLSVLSAESRLAWVELLCYVKAYGVSGGARALSIDRFARMIEVGEESVRKMLKAAEMDGAVTIVGNEWVIANWATYQGDPTGAERQRRFKERKKVTEGNGGNALVTAVTETETGTETREREESKPKKGRFQRPTLSQVKDYAKEIGYSKPDVFFNHYESNGWKIGKASMKDWKAALRNWQTRDKNSEQEVKEWH